VAEIKLFWSDKVKFPKRTTDKCSTFLQTMCNRLAVGQVRYGDPDKKQNYMTRLIMETKSYRRSGNLENLVNIANYALLESMCPENAQFHYDPAVGSATRGKMGLP
jgi:hypothetical protein